MSTCIIHGSVKGTDGLCEECRREVSERRSQFRVGVGPHGLSVLAERLWHFSAEMGWHDPAPSFGDCIANLHGEVSELWEAWRAGKVSERRAGPHLGLPSQSELCDKADKMLAVGLKPLTCAAEELADIVIRALEMGHALGVDIDLAIEVKTAYNASRGRRWEGKRV